MSTPLTGIAACVFDAYGTLFDVHAAARRCRSDLGPQADAVSAAWRARQLQYTWLRSLMGEYLPFWQVTADALDVALAEHDIDDPALRQRLLDLYLHLDAYPEVPEVLRALRDGGCRTAILSNGSRDMLSAAVDTAGLTDRLDAVLSVDDVGVFKPDPRVYAMATDRFACAPREICFLSANAWDAWAASHVGMRVVWVNRFDQPPERLPGRPDHQIRDLAELPSLLGL